MFTTIKAKINTYKWIIILCSFGLLTMGLGWQFHRASTLEITTKNLEETNKTLVVRIKEIDKEFTRYKSSTDKALADIDALRIRLTEIDEETATLKGRLGNLDKISKPVANGENRATIEDEVNKLSADIFNRIEKASKGSLRNEK